MRWLLLALLLLPPQFTPSGQAHGGTTPGFQEAAASGEVASTFDSAAACWSYDNSSDLGQDDCNAAATYDLTNNNSTGAAPSAKCTGAVYTKEATSNFLYGDENTNLNYTASFSVSVWAYSSTADIGNNEASYGGVVIANAETGEAGSWAISVEPTGDLNWYHWDATGNGTANADGRFVWSTAFAADAWHHIVVTMDASSVPTMYVDGVSLGAADLNVTTAGWNYQNRIYTGQNYSGNGYIFTGYVDEAAVFNEILSAEQIAALYNSGDGECIN